MPLPPPIWQERLRLSYPANVKIVRLPCTGKLDLIHILKSFEDGADGVVIMGCLEGTCHFLKGNLRARKRVEYMQRLLAEIRIEPERVEMFNISSSDGPSFAAIASQMTDGSAHWALFLADRKAVTSDEYQEGLFRYKQRKHQQLPCKNHHRPERQ